MSRVRQTNEQTAGKQNTSNSEVGYYGTSAKPRNKKAPRKTKGSSYARR